MSVFNCCKDCALQFQWRKQLFLLTSVFSVVPGLETHHITVTVQMLKHQRTQNESGCPHSGAIFLHAAAFNTVYFRLFIVVY